MLFGAADPTAVSAATDAASQLKDTAVPVIVAIIPMAITVYLVGRSLPLVKKFLKIGS